jgi:hypothetical protein
MSALGSVTWQLAPPLLLPPPSPKLPGAELLLPLPLPLPPLEPFPLELLDPPSAPGGAKPVCCVPLEHAPATSAARARYAMRELGPMGRAVCPGATSPRRCFTSKKRPVLVAAHLFTAMEADP